MKSIMSVICQNVITEVNTGSVSLIGMMNSITCKNLPTVIPSMSFFFAIQKSIYESELLTGALVIKQGGVTEKKIPIEADFQGKGRLDLTFTIALFQITKKGDLEFILEVDGKEIAKAKLEVKVDMPRIVTPGEPEPGIPIM